MLHRFARTTSLLLVIGLLGALVAPGSSAASPLDDKKAQAAQIQQQIDANGARIAALGEQYNGARIAYERAASGIAEAQRRFDAAQREVDTKREQVANRARRLYMEAGGHNPLEAVNVRDVSDLGRRTKYSAVASELDENAITELRIAQEDLARERAALEEEQARARAKRDAAETAKREIEEANASQEQLLGQVKGEIATLIEQERQRREEEARRSAAAAAARAASARSNAGPVRSSGPARRGVDPGSVGGDFPQVAVSGGVAAVIAYARAQLGKPYVFATAGPATFDCSGLTKMAWAQAGVSMAHFSGAQFNAFPHVPLNALQPGDLVFKGPGGRDHVALYIGGGMQIAATHTGDFVRLQPLGRNLSGAVRPG